MSKISFVIPAYNSGATIQKCVLSIISQTLQDKILEVLIVDSSDDQNIQGHLGFIPREKIQCFQLPERAIPARSRNIGAQAAKGDILCFVDSDTYLEPTWLETILEAINEGKLVGCGSVSIPEHQATSSVCLAQYYLQLNEFIASGQIRSKKFVPGCNIFCERKLFEVAGGFPEIRAAEDVLFCLKVGETEPVWFIPTAKAYHIFRETPQGILENQKLLGEYILRYRRQSFNKWYYKGITPILFLPLFLIIKVARIEYRIINAGTYHLKAHLKSWPWFLRGMVAWSQGFIKGCKQNY